MAIETAVIIEKLYRDKELNKAISKLIPYDLQHDAKHELFVSLYEKDIKECGWLDKAYHEGWILFYCVRTLMNFAKGSKFKREFIDYHESFNIENNDIIEEEYDLALDNLTQNLIDKVKDGLIDIRFVDQKVFELYANGANISQLSRDVGIPRNTLLNIISKVKNHFKEQFYDSDYLNSLGDISPDIRNVRQLSLF